MQDIEYLKQAVDALARHGRKADLTVLICGASTDNTVLWTSADAHQYRYKVVVVEDCCMVHARRSRPARTRARCASSAASSRPK